MAWTTVLCVLVMLAFGVGIDIPHSHIGPLHRPEPAFALTATYDHYSGMGNRVLRQEVCPSTSNPNANPNLNPNTNANPDLNPNPGPNPKQGGALRRILGNFSMTMRKMPV